MLFTLSRIEIEVILFGMCRVVPCVGVFSFSCVIPFDMVKIFYENDKLENIFRE
jgi:hypothetical protein